MKVLVWQNYGVIDVYLVNENTTDKIKAMLKDCAIRLAFSLPKTDANLPELISFINIEAQGDVETFEVLKLVDIIEV